MPAPRIITSYAALQGALGWTSWASVIICQMRHFKSIRDIKGRFGMDAGDHANGHLLMRRNVAVGGENSLESTLKRGQFSVPQGIVNIARFDNAKNPTDHFYVSTELT